MPHSQAATLNRRGRLVIGLALIFGLACGAIPSGGAPTPTAAPQVAATEAATAAPAPTDAGPGEQPTTAPQPGGVIAQDASYSSPIAISEDDALVVVVNTLNGSVSVLNVAGDANAKLVDIATGD